MRKRQLGQSDLQLTVLGLGAWAIGGEWAFGWGPQDDAQSVRTIHQALDEGINWIDTAAVYGLGHAEEVVARALEGRRGEVVVATKGGLRWRGKKVYSSLKGESIRQEVEDSLRRLRVEVIDIYQLHWPNPDAEIEEGWSAVAELVRQGKIRHAGVSNFSVSQLQRAQAIWPVTSLQPPFSMLQREIEQELLPYCAAQGIGVVVYSPLQAGLLTGAFSKQRLEGLPAGDWRRRDRFFQEPAFSAALALVERLAPLAAAQGCTVAQLALAWVLRRSEVTAAIVGARRPEQIKETAVAAALDFAAERWQEVEALLAR